MEPLDRLTKVIERRCGRDEVGAAVRLLVGGAQELARAFKEGLLQAVIERGEARTG
jgi:hypothetical protein